MGHSSGELAKRVGVAAVLIPIALMSAYLGGFWLAALLATFALLGAREFYAMYADEGIASASAIGAVIAPAFVLLAVGSGISEFVVWATLIALAAATFTVLGPATDSRPGLAAAVTVFGAFYTGGLLAFAVWLRGLDAASGWRGTAILFLPVAITWLGDTVAYSIGSAMGRHALAPTISPNKTWEGAVAGFVATTAGALLYLGLTDSIVGWTMTGTQAIGFGAAIAVAGQAGDLVESRFKRDCGVKDSSALLPGHGGVLDRLDSLFFVFPVGYAYLWAVGV